MNLRFGGRRLDGQLGDIILHELFDFVVVQHDAADQILVQRCNGDVIRNGKHTQNTGGAAVLCQHGDTVFDGVLRLVDGQFLALIGDGARRVAAQTEQTLHQLGALGTDQTRNAEDLALADVEVDVTEALGVDGREVLDLKHDLTGRIRARRVEVRQLTSDHLGDDHIGGQFLGLPGADVLAVTHDRDFVADAKNFVHLVADVDDGNALGAQLVHDGEQRLDLGRRQRGGRLVEDQYLAVCGDRLGDLNQLHLGNAQGSELCVRIIIQMDFLQDLGRILIHLVVVDDGDGSVFLGWVAPDVDILADGTLRDGLQFLVHHRNAAIQCIQRSLDLNLLPLINNLAFVHVVDTEHTLHQGGLARAVLAHQCMDGAGFQFQLCVIQCLDAGERLDDITHLQAVL